MEKLKYSLGNPWDIINELELSESMGEELQLDDILVDIAMRFINYRVDNNLSQKQLAEKLGVSQTMVSKYESGEYNISIGQLVKVCNKLGWILNINVDDIKNEQFNWDDGTDLECLESYCISNDEEYEYGACA